MKYGIYKFDYDNRVNKLLLEFDTFEDAENECKNASRRWQVCSLYVGGIDENGDYVELQD